MDLAILFGGASFEHEISIVSAITLQEKLGGFELRFIFCDQDHNFYLIDAKKMKAKTFASGEYKKMPRLALERGAFMHKRRFSSVELKMPVLNLIHGGDGEDGTVSALLEFYNIPFIGPRPAASVLSFDKHYTKWLAASVGIKTVDYEVLDASSVREIATPLPFIVKPARLGSSIGVSVVRDESEIDYALDVAFEFDNAVLIEPFIEGVKEYNLAGYRANGKMVYSIIEEPQKNDFLDFDKKYLDFSRTAAVNEAQLESETVNALHHAFDRIYKGLFEGALIRCDFFLVDGKVCLNEINPIPGSMANYLFEDFEGAVRDILSDLPVKKSPKVTYQYIHSIHAAKGK